MVATDGRHCTVKLVRVDQVPLDRRRLDFCHSNLAALKHVGAA